MKNWVLACAFAAIAFICTALAWSEVRAEGHSGAALVAQSPYRMHTRFTGSGNCLDVLNDGTNNQLRMRRCGDYSGQRWWGDRAPEGLARLKNTFTGGGKCLDVVNDGSNDKVALAPCGNYSGQFWWAEEATPGTVRLKNTFTGSGKCLDIVNDGTDDRLRLAPCGDYTGQMWIVDR